MGIRRSGQSGQRFLEQNKEKIEDVLHSDRPSRSATTCSTRRPTSSRRSRRVCGRSGRRCPRLDRQGRRQRVVARITEVDAASHPSVCCAAARAPHRVVALCRRADISSSLVGQAPGGALTGRTVGVRFTEWIVGIRSSETGREDREFCSDAFGRSGSRGRFVQHISARGVSRRSCYGAVGMRAASPRRAVRARSSSWGSGLRGDVTPTPSPEGDGANTGCHAGAGRRDH